MKNRAKRLVGRFDSETVASTPATLGKHPIPEVETLADTFRITVKDDNDTVVYENKEESYEYHKVPSLVTALQYLGASLTEDKIQFLNEALAGDKEKVGKAVADLVETFNADLKDRAKNNRYQSVFNQHKPLTEENKDNAVASIVRNFVKLNNVSDETAIQTLKEYKVIPAEYTVGDFRGNKGKR